MDNSLNIFQSKHNNHLQIQHTKHPQDESSHLGKIICIPRISILAIWEVWPFPSFYGLSYPQSQQSATSLDSLSYLRQNLKEVHIVHISHTKKKGLGHICLIVPSFFLCSYMRMLHTNNITYKHFFTINN